MLRDILLCLTFSYILDLNIDTDEKLSANLFSTCGVEVPGVCNSFSPPRKFLDCAHDGDGDGNDGDGDGNDGDGDGNDGDGDGNGGDGNGNDGDGDGNDGDGNGKDGDVHATPTVFFSIILIMVSLFNIQS